MHNGQKSPVRYSPWGQKVRHDLVTKPATAKKMKKNMHINIYSEIYIYTHTHIKERQKYIIIKYTFRNCFS